MIYYYNKVVNKQKECQEKNDCLNYCYALAVPFLIRRGREM